MQENVFFPKFFFQKLSVTDRQMKRRIRIHGLCNGITRVEDDAYRDHSKQGGLEMDLSRKSWKLENLKDLQLWEMAENLKNF